MGERIFVGICSGLLFGILMFLFDKHVMKSNKNNLKGAVFSGVIFAVLTILFKE